ncbi:helix-turn-helix transcriptional regulator [Haloplasma contractile]|uniref:Transcriptional regulator DeoR family protein n=1 Tax=Haloplasma contractile SSD-17B TaxID=1033810 RepID=F7PWH2_9MOLU|nr:YafY family protein [Haloplasma contractile]ERJ11892.1 Transcriptional regulator DeoR family protein [Haloplasma contractile SSD-17B]
MRVQRLLSILLVLANKKMVTAKELADHFEVSIRTIYRDVEKIGEAGVPIASTSGKGGGFYILDDYHLDNWFFDQKEIEKLMPLVENMRLLFGKNQHYNDIGLKLQHTFKTINHHDQLTINLSHFNMEGELKQYLSEISQGIEEQRLLIIMYINRYLVEEERIIEPIQISYSSGQWYVKAYCRMRNGYRSFKLVRIKTLKLGDHCKSRNHTIEEVNQQLKEGYNENSIKVKLKLLKRLGGHITEHFRKESIITSTNDYYIIEDLFPYDEGLTKFILSLGNSCEVLEPTYLRTEVKTYLNHLISIYKD